MKLVDIDKENWQVIQVTELIKLDKNSITSDNGT